MQADSKFAGLVPLERDEYIDKVVAAVAKYSHHKPSSLQHYEQKRLADVAGLNGFISSMSRLTNVWSALWAFRTRRGPANLFAVEFCLLQQFLTR
jgi:2-polyprenyl-6-methoxyphenol hydroxylase-like FAD-dependent oxidoreductase